MEAMEAVSTRSGPQRAPTAAMMFLRRLRHHGVEKLFLNPGTDFPPLVEAYRQAAVAGDAVPEPVLVPYESTAVAMAHGYYLRTGRAQAVMVHVSVGTANTVNALANASRDQVPLLLCAGRSPITEQGRLGSRSRPIHWAQEMFDQAGLVREWVKWEYELRDPAQIIDIVDRACEAMNAAPCGPVYLTLPREPLAAPVEPGVALSCPRHVAAPATSAEAELETLAAMLARSTAPLIIASGYGRRDTDAAPLGALAERLAIPVVAPAPRFAPLPFGHAMFCGSQGDDLLAQADLVVVLDTDAPWIPSLLSPPSDARVVHIAADPHWLRLPIRSFRSDLSIRADSAQVLAAVLPRVQPHEDRVSERRRRIGTWQSARRARLAEESRPGSSVTIAFASRVIGEQLADAVIVNEYSLQPDHAGRGPGCYYGLGSAGGLGWGMGAALGIKAADPGMLVVATVGDGAYMFMNPTACHWTADVHRLPILTIVFNNGRYGAVRNATSAMYPSGMPGAGDDLFLADLRSQARWAEIVAAHGGHGERVDRPDDLAPAIRRARQAVQDEGRQALIDIVCA